MDHIIYFLRLKLLHSENKTPQKLDRMISLESSCYLHRKRISEGTYFIRLLSLNLLNKEV